MAIMALGLRTMPSMRNVSTIRPAFPGGRFSGGAFPARALVSSVSNGSRRTTAALSTAGFSAGGLAEFPEAALVLPLPAAGAFAAAFAGAFAGAFADAGPDGFAGDGAGVCGALGGWDSPGTCFVSWSRTAVG